ncbi:4-hydroxy-tetrahydrodipicolinate synthase [Paenibacillus cellulosilyticus]|uniref:4-hydroxy-tetrahydrodipicolinate synthase n=1 Tax=Paenibacillus cellulosilyticus TaxID=375489 RepID=A0A2V2YUG2_9BACL|nr:dihydrodipicolinate synthase family protein [Paenibacillus cellulosilyticus]PWW04725.1 4-hydroxy-tetrahydrodipicolinate synthase [Paenibacillus cellulosilyticus]QKS45852.1 dihydrodipicolinate synthase family protein [Paenibacillus cellulosilyticus]
MFTGLSAFPLTPMNETAIDEAAFVRIIERLADAKVHSIGALGSTGSYMYLTREERKRVAQLAVENANGVPVMVGIGALRTRDVLHYAEDAQQSGVSAVLLAPVSYQPLTEREVFSLYETVARSLTVPLCIYDNPRVTHFNFSDRLIGEIAQLPQVGGIKIPPVSSDPAEARARVDKLRSLVPSHVKIGISGDFAAAAGLNAGCDTWYSVLGGLFPKTCLPIIHAAQTGDTAEIVRLSDRLEPVWDLFRQHGGLRVIAAAAELLGCAPSPNLPQPIQPLDEAARQQLDDILQQLELNA